MVTSSFTPSTHTKVNIGRLICLVGHVSSLAYWGWVTHICVSKLTIIGFDNDLSPDRRQAIIGTNAGILLIRSLGTNFSEIHTFSFKKMCLKVLSAKWRPFCLCLSVLTTRVYSNGWYLLPLSFKKKNFSANPEYISELSETAPPDSCGCADSYPCCTAGCVTCSGTHCARPSTRCTCTRTHHQDRQEHHTA